MESSIDSKTFCFLSADLNTKFTVIIFALFLTATSCLLSFGVIWYDHNGNDNYRTLIHRGATLMAWYGLIGIPVIEIFDILQSILGTFPRQICLAGLIVKNMIKTQVLLCMDLNIIFRYVLIFHLKNPLAVQDEFWTTFFCSWIVGFSFVYNTTFFILPGKKPLNYYICSDIDPSSDSNLTIKMNVYVEIFSLLLHMAINLKIKMYKKNHVLTEQHHNNHSLTLDEKTITSLTINLTIILITIVHFGFSVKTRSLTLAQINSNPYKLLVIGFHLLGNVILSNSISAVYYLRNEKLRKTIMHGVRTHF
jgi:hypothetical protein